MVSIETSIEIASNCPLLEVRMLITPTQASQEMWPNVCMLPSPKLIVAATATNTAVQAPWDERAFNAVAMPSIPEPPTKIQSFNNQQLVFVYALGRPDLQRAKVIPKNS